MKCAYCNEEIKSKVEAWQGKSHRLEKVVTVHVDCKKPFDAWEKQVKDLEKRKRQGEL